MCTNNAIVRVTMCHVFTLGTKLDSYTFHQILFLHAALRYIGGQGYGLAELVLWGSVSRIHTKSCHTYQFIG